MSLSQHEKGVRFRALHDGPDTFVIPNSWDVPSSRLLAGLGFQALATSSAAAAATVSRRDGGMTREQAMEHSRAIVNATDLPVSADLGFPFMLTARAHNLLYPNGKLEDTIRRLQAFEKAGADVLFAPGLPDVAAVRAVCSAVSKPVNFMVGIKGKSFSVPELAAAGVKRISLATSLYRAAMTGLLNAASAVKDHGDFSFLDACATTAELNKLMRI
jgi:2-methylisocitrate lyase-like PEP mutase family enzyme